MSRPELLDPSYAGSKLVGCTESTGLGSYETRPRRRRGRVRVLYLLKSLLVVGQTNPALALSRSTRSGYNGARNIACHSGRECLRGRNRG
jgi:hypothetical protein